jgi:integrase
VPHEVNLRRAREHLQRIKARIEAGTFRFSEEFPDYTRAQTLTVPLAAQTCGDIFDAFLAHDARRVARGDLAPITLASHRQILDHVWRPHLGALPFLDIRHSRLVKIADAHAWNKKTYNNAISALRRAFEFGYRDHPERRDPAAALRSARIGKKDRPRIDPFSIQDAETLIAALHREWGEAQGNYDEFRFFTGLRPSEEIALVVSDYDAAHAVLSITKARVHGVDRDVTKTGEDRRIELGPRAVAVLERQLRLRERLLRERRLDHEALFCTAEGQPLRHLAYPYARWRRTLRRLAIRYRKPYAARHTSVSWQLMLGRNPLWVARQHGHSISTMLWVYAAWIGGVTEGELACLQDAMTRAGLPDDVERGAADRVRAVPAAPAFPRKVKPGTVMATRRRSSVPSSPSGSAPSEVAPERPALGSGLATRPQRIRGNYLKDKRNDWRRG